MIKGFPYKEYKRLIKKMQGDDSAVSSGKVYKEDLCVVKCAKEKDATREDLVSV